jgi:hypothetical protein
MSTDILKPYLKSIADAIKIKKGTTETINAQNFATEIVNLSSGGGNSNVIELSNLPTVGVDDTKIYLASSNETSNIQVYYHDESSYCTLAQLVAAQFSVTPTITYSVVDALPESPSISDLATFSTVYCYIHNNTSYVYGDAGAGESWVPVSALVSQLSGNAVTDKGRTENIENENSDLAIYVYYEETSVQLIGSPKNSEVYDWNGAEWVEKGAKVIRKGEYIGTPLLSGTHIENIYCNIALTPSEIDDLIKNADLTWIPSDGLNLYPLLQLEVDGTTALNIMLIDVNGMGYAAIDNESSLFLFHTIQDAEVQNEFGPAGWNPELITINGVLSISGDLVGEGTFGTENDKLSGLISASPFTRLDDEKTLLSGTYDGSSISIDKNGDYDVRELLANQKLPLNINVEIPAPPIPDDYIKPSGSLTITSNGEYNVKTYEQVVVDLKADRPSVLVPYNITDTTKSTIVTAKLSAIDILNYSHYELIQVHRVSGTGDITFVNKSYNPVSGIATIEITASEPSYGTLYVAWSPIDWLNLLCADEVTNISRAQLGTRVRVRDYMFYKSNLETIDLPDSVFGIGDYAFSESNLTSIQVPTNPGPLGKHIFAQCEKLTSATILSTVVTDYMFWACTSLTSLTLGNNIKSIGVSGFADCKKLQSVVIPESVTSIGSHAFRSCISLNSVVIPDSVTEIGSHAFGSCSSLTSIVIPESVTSISDSLLSSCTLLTSIEIPNSVTSIGSSAFNNCDSLTSVEIPNSVTSIGDLAFFGCNSLASVVIGNGVTSIGEMAFYSCTSLIDIIYNGTIEQWNAITKNIDWNYNAPATKVVCTDGEVTL